MPISLACPSCQKQYHVPDTLAGKQVRCQRCSHVFAVAAPPPAAESSAFAPRMHMATRGASGLQAAALQPVGLDPLLGADLPPLGAPLPSAALLPAAGLGTPLSPEGRPMGYAPLPSSSPYAPSSYGGPTAPPLEGPTDAQMRMGSAACIALALLLGGICVGTYLFDGSVFLWPLFLAPLLVLLGIAGLIDPNVVRAIGKYGKHLPLTYKLIGWSLMGAWVVIMICLAIVMIQMGFRPGR